MPQCFRGARTHPRRGCRIRRSATRPDNSYRRWDERPAAYAGVPETGAPTRRVVAGRSRTRLHPWTSPELVGCINSTIASGLWTHNPYRWVVMGSLRRAHHIVAVPNSLLTRSSMKSLTDSPWAFARSTMISRTSSGTFSIVRFAIRRKVPSPTSHLRYERSGGRAHRRYDRRSSPGLNARRRLLFGSE